MKNEIVKNWKTVAIVGSIIGLVSLVVGVFIGNALAHEPYNENEELENNDSSSNSKKDEDDLYD